VGEPPCERYSPELIQMSENNLLIEDGVEVAPPAWLQPENKDE
jgi:hypothetical protein